MLVFYTWGIIGTGWHDLYYLWDKAKDLLLFIAIFFLVHKKVRWAIKPIIVFSSIRLIWQIISSLTGLNINNTKIVGWLFIAAATISDYLFIKGLIKWQRQN